MIISFRAKLEKANKVDENVPKPVENDSTKDSNNQPTEEVSIFKFEWIVIYYCIFYSLEIRQFRYV